MTARLLAALALATTALGQVAPRTVCASTDANGVVGDLASARMQRLYCGTAGCYFLLRGSASAISADGRFVVFTSDATNFSTPAPPPQRANVYRKDLETGAIALVSATPQGSFGNDDSGLAPSDTTEACALAVSADGRVVAFTSYATDLAPGDSGFKSDVFVRDMASGTTQRVSQTIFGASPSADSFGPRLTPDGRYLGFYSAANDLVAGDNNNYGDVFLYDRVSATLERVSLASNGAPANAYSFDVSLSADARFVAFCSAASNLDGPFPNGTLNVYVRDRVAGSVVRASRTPLGQAINQPTAWPRLSADGRFVVFTSAATNLVQPPDPLIAGEVFLCDLGTLAVSRISFAAAGPPGANTAGSPSISADGRYVAYHSGADVLVPGDTNLRADAFLLDRNSAVLTRVSVDSALNQSNGNSFYPTMTPDARAIVFNSGASNLDPADTTLLFDVFVHDRGWSGAVESYCVASPNSAGCIPALAGSGAPSATAGAGFSLNAANLLNQRTGLYFYGTGGATLTPFGSSTMCVRPPRVRTAAQSTGGSPASVTDCSGTLALDFNTVAASGSDPALVAGAEVWLQGWSRDPALLSKTHLTQGLHFQLGP